MLEYLFSLFILSASLGVVLYSAYPSAQTKSVRFAAAVILLSATLSPVISLVGTLSPDGIDGIFDSIGKVEFPEGSQKYEQVAEEAFTLGIKKLILEKYSLSEEDVEVFVSGFDFEKMRAEKIKVVLSSTAALADWRAIGEYISSEGLGECEVNIKIG